MVDTVWTWRGRLGNDVGKEQMAGIEPEPLYMLVLDKTTRLLVCFESVFNIELFHI